MKPYPINETKPALAQEMLCKYETPASNRMLLIMEANKGVRVNALYDLVYISGHKKDFFADLLNLSVKTIDRYKRESKKLNPSNSEMVLKLFVLYKKGNEVFGSISAFNNWLDKPAFGLGSSAPVAFMHTSGGIDLILEELSRIEYGDLA